MKNKIRIILAAGAILIATMSFARLSDSKPETTTHEQTAKVAPAPKPKIELCFVLDTTGSMGGLIEGAKQKIWSIANEMISTKPTPEIRIGLVAYRDHGDEYVTKVYDLTNDIDSVYANLKLFQADGGGDEPEAVNEAIADAVNKISWSQDRKVLKMMFLVGDAPPHMDYKGPKYPELCQQAMKKDIIINSVQCGNISRTAPVWKEIAKLSEGNYIAIAQDGNMMAVSTPVDEDIAKINREIGTTVIAYGSAREQSEITTKYKSVAAAAAPIAADRASYNWACSGKVVNDSSDLLNTLNDKKINLNAVRKSELPKELQSLNADDLQKHVETQQKKRNELQSQLVKLSKERDAYIEKDRARQLKDGKGDRFDTKVAEIIRTEAARKGISYEK